MAEVTVVTACYGDIDDPIEQPEQDIDVRWVAVMRRPFESKTWEVVQAPRPHLSDRMAAKIVKFRPDIYADTQNIIWFDGSVSLKRSDAVRHLLEPITEQGYTYATLQHPLWNDIESETKHTKDLNRYRGQMLDEQLAHYQSIIRGAHVPVYATAIQARRNTGLTREFGDAVIHECVRWTCHDQLSMPVVA